MKQAVRYGFILGIICFLASAVLAIVDAVTEPNIKIQQAKEEKAALEEVFPEAAIFKPRLSQEEVLYFLAYDKDNKLLGFVIKAQAKGYSSEIETLVGLNLNLKIKQVKVLSQNETPGLGSRIAMDSFTGRFAGKNLAGLNDVQAITGATISSGAVIKSIKDKLAGLNEQLTRETNNGK